ncbi:hypothetical protein NL108_014649 [Boleophthalmus pectinirostris]|nr:hypothetical protein NL108_014649 [Boleophthalmus pectinirostris]
MRSGALHGGQITAKNVYILYKSIRAMLCTEPVDLWKLPEHTVWAAAQIYTASSPASFPLPSFPLSSFFYLLPFILITSPSSSYPFLPPFLRCDYWRLKDVSLCSGSSEAARLKLLASLLETKNSSC